MYKHKLFAQSAICIFAALFCLQSQAQTTQPIITLNVGDPAPALKVGGWFKGTPTESFTPGKVYVVEFWATWCGPCKRMIPHLTEMAKSHAGKATFIGVSVWERPEDETEASIAALVTPFVKKMGDQMDYNVAADGVNKFMATEWMKAAGRDSIPAAFVVGRDQHIAWVGYPADLEPVLDQVIADKWDIAAEQKRFAAELATKARQNEFVSIIKAARKAGDDKAALAAVDKEQAEFPSMVANGDLISIRFEALMHTDTQKALMYIKDLTDKDGVVTKQPDYVWSILRMFPKGSSLAPFTMQDWKAIADECKPTVDMNKANYSDLYSEYAIVLEHAGEIHSAVQYQKKAVDIELKWNQTHQETLRPASVKILNDDKDFLAELSALDK